MNVLYLDKPSKDPCFLAFNVLSYIWNDLCMHNSIPLSRMCSGYFVVYQGFAAIIMLSILIMSLGGKVTCTP